MPSMAHDSWIIMKSLFGLNTTWYWALKYPNFLSCSLYSFIKRNCQDFMILMCHKNLSFLVSLICSYFFKKIYFSPHYLLYFISTIMYPPCTLFQLHPPLPPLQSPPFCPCPSVIFLFGLVPPLPRQNLLDLSACSLSKSLSVLLVSSVLFTIVIPFYILCTWDLFNWDHLITNF